MRGELVGNLDKMKLLESFMALKLAEQGKLPLCRGPEREGRLLPGDGQESALLASDKMVADMPALAFSPEQIAKITPLGRTFVFEAVKRGDLPSRKLGKHRVVMARDLVEWLMKDSAA